MRRDGAARTGLPCPMLFLILGVLGAFPERAEAREYLGAAAGTFALLQRDREIQFGEDMVRMQFVDKNAAGPLLHGVWMMLHHDRHSLS